MNSNSEVTSKRTSLNPNAKEFVPTALQTAVAFEQEAGISIFLEHCEEMHDTSLLDEESRRYWDSHLPDDILTPDLMDSVFEDKQESVLDGITKEVEFTSSNQVVQGITTPDAYPNEEDRSVAWIGKFAPPSNRLPSSGNSWSTPLSRSENGFEYSPEFVEKRLASHRHGDLGPAATHIHEYRALASQIRADVYQAHGDDLNILSKLKLQEDESIWRGARLQPSSSTNSNFSALSSPDELINRLPAFFDEVKDREPAEFGTSTRRSTFQRRNGAAEFSLGPPRFSSQHLSSFDERFDHPVQRRNHRAASQSWLENADTAANVSSDGRESRNFTRARNPYFEQQARPAYFKGRAKEASAKGHVHNRFTKAPHTRGGDLFAQQRSMPTPHFSTFSPGQPRLLDLHGLHNNMNEAVTLLRQELCATRAVARSSRQRQQIFIFVGSDRQKSSRGFPAFILGIERYLAENEHLSFTEPQPGVIKVVV